MFAAALVRGSIVFALLFAISAPSPAQCGDDALEPNDDCAQAVALAPDAHFNVLVLRGFAHPNGPDPDHYRTVVMPGESLEVLVDAFIGPLFVMEIFDDGACTAPIASGPAPGRLRVMNASAAPHEYWIAVRPDPVLGDFDCESYTLDLDTFVDVCLGLPPDALEPNDSLPSAAPLPPGFYPSLNISGGETDYYLIPAAPGSLIELSIAQNFPEYPGLPPTLVFIDAVTGQALQGASPNGTTTYVNLTSNPAVGLRVILTPPGTCSSHDLGIVVEATPCTAFAPDVFEPNEPCASSVAPAPGAWPDLNTMAGDADFYSAALQPGEVLVAVASYDAGPASGIRMSAYQGCNVNDFFQVQHLAGRETTLVRNDEGVASDFTFVVGIDNQQLDPLAPCAEYDLEVRHHSSTIGSSYCPAVPNSSGSPARLDAYGSLAAGDGEIGFLVTDVPTFAPGIIFYGPTQTQAPLGDGLRCVGGTLRRLNPVTFAGTRAQIFHVVDFDAGHALLNLLPGTTWHFQAWFRDGSSSNLSNAVTIDLQ